MTSYPTSLSNPPALSDEATLEVALDCLLEHVELEMQGNYSPKPCLKFYCELLANTTALNTPQRAWREPRRASRLPERIINRKHRLAIALHLRPYYGKASTHEPPYLYCSQAKSGTTSFFAYATVYGICRNRRVTLAIHAVHRQETLVATLTILLAALSSLRVKLKGLYLDRGFYCVPVIRWLQGLKVAFVMPAVIRGKQGGTRPLLVGHQSYATTYTLNSQVHGTVACQMRVICRYGKGQRHQHGIQDLVYVVHRVKLSLQSIHHYYRERFGIETSDRMKNHCRIRTTTKNPVVRLLFVALAFVLVNLWVYLLWYFVSPSKQGGRVVYRQLFPLKTMLEFLCHAVERRFPPVQVIYLPISP